MKFLLKILSLFILFFFLGLISSKQVFADTFALSGNVRTSTGNNIDNATVEVIDTGNNTTVANTTTNSDGNYSMVINGGTYKIMVTPSAGSSYSPATILNQTISGNTVLNFVLVQSTSFTLRGQVLDVDGLPVVGQRVSLPNFEQSVITDINGNYSFQVSAGNVAIHIAPASAQANTPSWYRLDLGATVNADTVFNIYLPVKRVSIHVQDATGVGVAEL